MTEAQDRKPSFYLNNMNLPISFISPSPLSILETVKFHIVHLLGNGCDSKHCEILQSQTYQVTISLAESRVEPRWGSQHAPELLRAPSWTSSGPWTQTARRIAMELHNRSNKAEQVLIFHLCWRAVHRVFLKGGLYKAEGLWLSLEQN